MPTATDDIAEGKAARTPPRALSRVTFRTSREMDFFSERELCAQTGHSPEEWPAVIAKELVDNALDACEERDIPPEITIAADASGITVSDNGPGIPEGTIAGILDFTVRTSSREAYRSPTRGAQGNALKTLVGMPYVLDAESGRLVITTGGWAHGVVCRLDEISQKVVFDVEKTKVCEAGTGANFYKSAVRVEWGCCDWPFGEDGAPEAWRGHFLTLARGYALFNPHLTLTLDWFGDLAIWKATDLSWTKWRPNQPTSPHWYDLSSFDRLVGAYITHDREKGTDRTVAEFVAEFDGLTGSGNRGRAIEQAGLKRCKLSSLAGERNLKSADVGRLLDCMKAQTKPVHYRRLGQIGRDHFTRRLLEFGCIPESITYAVRKRIDDGVAFVLESVFGALKEDKAPRQIYSGANWSAGIKNPFRAFGRTGEGLEAVLQQQRAGRHEPIVFALHLAHPRVEYSDRGKSAIVVRA